MSADIVAGGHAATAFGSNENLVGILLWHVHAYVFDTFPNCLRVCRLWNSESQRVRWRDPVVLSRDAKRFLELLPSVNVRRIHSLTMVKVWKGLMSLHGHQLPPWLVKWLPIMHNLKSLSIVNFSYSRRNCNVMKNLAIFVRSLAHSSVENLELEDFGSVPEIPTTNTHLCKCLSFVLPGLRRLRLFDFEPCLSLFDELNAPCPKLEEVVVHVDWLRGNCCAPPAQHAHPQTYIRSMVRAAQDARARGYFPCVTHLSLWGTRSLDRTRYRPWSNRLFSCWYEIDVLGDSTTVYPYFTVDGTWSLATDIVHSTLCFQWMLYRDPDTRHEVGLIEDGEIDHFVTAHPTWLKSSTGARLSSAFRSGGQYQWEGSARLESMAARERSLRSSVNGGLHPVTQLWFWEHVVGRKLLGVKTYAGARLPSYPMRRLPDEERMFHRNPHDRNLARYLSRLPC